LKRDPELPSEAIRARDANRLLGDDASIRKIALADEQRCKHQQRETLAVEITDLLEPCECRTRRGFRRRQSFLA
jgi:hypothetical protein